jgi:hypothetical protein
MSDRWPANTTRIKQNDPGPISPWIILLLIKCLFRPPTTGDPVGDRPPATGMRYNARRHANYNEVTIDDDLAEPY